MAMVDVVFYEKPGCINNRKQKDLLLQAGHRVESRNLLIESWNKYLLQEYFDAMSVTMWFNCTAPDIKSGLIDPSDLTEDEAFELMIANPILIRRPLMRVGDECRVGFDINLVDQWIGLSHSTEPDLETCPRSSSHGCESAISNHRG